MENKDISRIVHNTLRRIDNYNLDIVRMKVKDIKYVLEYCVSLEKERDGIYSDYQDLGKEKLKLEEKVEHIRNRAFEEGNIAAKQLKEQEKIIDSMSERISCYAFLKYLTEKGKANFCVLKEIECKEKECDKKCVIDYFKKKANENNGK